MDHSAYDMFSFLFVNLVFPHLGSGSEWNFQIAPFSGHCLLLPFQTFHRRLWTSQFTQEPLKGIYFCVYYASNRLNKERVVFQLIIFCIYQ